MIKNEFLNFVYSKKKVSKEICLNEILNFFDFLTWKIMLLA